MLGKLTICFSVYNYSGYLVPVLIVQYSSIISEVRVNNAKWQYKYQFLRRRVQQKVGASNQICSRDGWNVCCPEFVRIQIFQANAPILVPSCKHCLGLGSLVVIWGFSIFFQGMSLLVLLGLEDKNWIVYSTSVFLCLCECASPSFLLHVSVTYLLMCWY